MTGAMTSVMTGAMTVTRRAKDVARGARARVDGRRHRVTFAPCTARPRARAVARASASEGGGRMKASELKRALVEAVRVMDAV